jgi:hypothetical protein
VRYQTGRALGVELLLPRIERVPRHADERCKVTSWQATALPGIEDEKALLRR